MSEIIQPENQIQNPIPHDFNIELSIINSLLHKNDLFFQIHDRISETDFLNKENSFAFKIIKEHILSSAPIDITILKAKLPKDFTLREKLSLETKTANEIKEYAKILVDKRLKRDLIFIGGEIMQDSMSSEEANSADILNKYKTKLANIETYDDKFSCEPIDISCHSHKTLMKERQDGTVGILTDIPKLDEYLNGGFKNGDFIVIGARPSVGKTCLATQLALASSRKNKNTIFVTAEMSKEDILDRIIMSFGEFNPYDIIAGKVDLKRLNVIYKELSKYKLKILELINGTTQHIISVGTKEKLLNNVDIIFIDYLQYLRDNEGKMNENNRVGLITRNLKGLARELNIPIVLLSQLNRNPEYRKDKIPSLSDLRESGDIEQNADVVLLLHRQRRDDLTLDVRTNLFVAKNRKGATGRIKLNFNYKTLTFEPTEFSTQDLEYDIQSNDNNL